MLCFRGLYFRTQCAILGLHPSGMLHSVGLNSPGLLDPWRWNRCVGIYQPTLRNIPEERRSRPLTTPRRKPEISRRVLSAIMFFFIALVLIHANQSLGSNIFLKEKDLIDVQKTKLNTRISVIDICGCILRTLNTVVNFFPSHARHLLTCNFCIN